MRRRREFNPDTDANVRDSKQFMEYFLRPAMVNTVSAYTHVEPFPLPEDEQVARYLDRCFGEPDLCALARKTWALWDETHIVIRTRLYAKGEPVANQGVVGAPRRVPVQIEVDGCFLSFKVPQFYAACDYGSVTMPFIGKGYSADALRDGTVAFRRILPSASESDREFAADIARWARDVRARSNEASAAFNFVDRIASLCDSTHAFFKALPGMRGVCEMLRVRPSKVEEAGQPYRGHDVFNNMLADRSLPLWRTQWSEQHRPALLKMAAANNTASQVGLYVPEAMFVIVPDKK